MDRCLLTVTAPRDGLPDEPPPPAPDTIEARWTDLEYLSALNDYGHRRTFYGAEAFPRWSPGYPGHASMPTFYGSRLTLDWHTGWHEPVLTGERPDVSGLKLNRECRWWEFGRDVLLHAGRASAGKSIPSIHALSGCGDTLASLRGSQRLLFDLMDDPGGVREAELKLMDNWIEVFEFQTGLLRDCDEGYATWFPLWSPGRFYPTQCDVSYGISPRSFRECFVPALRKQVDYLDHTIYHVDGVGAFPLVEEVCRIERIGAVQILPGAGKPSPLYYMDVLRTVQRMGKRLHITIAADEVPAALSQLSSRGLCIQTRAESVEQARRIIEDARRLSVDRG